MLVSLLNPLDVFGVLLILGILAIGLWLGWNCKWRYVLIYLPAAAVMFYLGLGLRHAHSIPVFMIGEFLSWVAPLSLAGALAGKLISKRKAKKDHGRDVQNSDN